MTWRSTTLRVALLVFLLQVAAGVALLLVLDLKVQNGVRAAAALQANTMRDDLLATYGEGGLSGLVSAVRTRSLTAITPGAVLLVTDAAGRPLAGDLPAWPAGLPTKPEARQVSVYRTGRVAPEMMWVRATVLPGGGRLLTGGVVEGAGKVLHSFERAAMLCLVLAIAFAALAASLSARMIVGRLDRTVETLRAARSGDLSRRVAPDTSGDAFAMLAAEVNRTLERVDLLVGELKIATDGLAHDLKSPLTRLRSALESAARRAIEPDEAAIIERALVENDRVLGIVGTALQISRAEAGIGREHFAVIDLADELRGIAEIYGPVVEEHGRDLVILASGPAMLSVHRELLGQALGNLIDNSLKYGTGTITLELARVDGRAKITVTDRGAGIEASQRGQALTRFGRLDQARGLPGAGLGLPLAAAVASLHGGSIELTDAEPGLSVILLLPDLRGRTSALLD